MRRIVILGTGGHAREQLDLVAAINRAAPTFEVLGFVVDRRFGEPGEEVRGLPVLGDLEWLSGHVSEVEVICGIGDPAARRAVVRRSQQVDTRFPSLVHPSAVLTDTVELGEGAIVCAGCVVSSDVRIGAHTHLNIGSTVSHDCVLESFVSLAPGVRLAGLVHVAEGAQLGVSTAVSDRKRIGAWSITGAGSVIVADVPENTTVAGVPGRVIKRREPGWQLGT